MSLKFKKKTTLRILWMLTYSTNWGFCISRWRKMSRFMTKFMAPIGFCSFSAENSSLLFVARIDFVIKAIALVPGESYSNSFSDSTTTSLRTFALISLCYELSSELDPCDIWPFSPSNGDETSSLPPSIGCWSSWRLSTCESWAGS